MRGRLGGGECGDSDGDSPGEAACFPGGSWPYGWGCGGTTEKRLGTTGGSPESGAAAEVRSAKLRGNQRQALRRGQNLVPTGGLGAGASRSAAALGMVDKAWGRGVPIKGGLRPRIGVGDPGKVGRGWAGTEQCSGGW